jgi:UDP-N-acetylglucosamine 4-epimerase
MAPCLRNAAILVTGGAGFIGSHLAEAFLAQDNTVVCLDNLSTGHRENIAPFLSHPRFTFIEGDIRSPADCRRAVQGVDFVSHHAALASVPASIDDPATANDVNIGGFVNILHAAAEARVRRFVYASSSAVYGDDPALPKREETTGAPLSPYALAKSVDEQYAALFRKLYGIETVGFRYFNVFGRRQDPEGAYAAVIPRFFQAYLAHTAPVINGDGANTRDFVHVSNVVHANQLALLASAPAALDTVYNIACAESTTLNDLADAIRDVLLPFDPAVAEIRPLHGPARPGDIPHSLASIDKARRLLGYAPAILYRPGLREAAPWYRQTLS